MKTIAFLLCLLSTLLASPPAKSATGPLEPPVLQKGQFVYSIPDGFLTEGISSRGVAEIQNASTALHYPVFVVLVKEIPDLTSSMLAKAREDRYKEKDDDLKVTFAIDALASDWIKAESGLYDPQKATILLLSSNPRKFRMLAGLQWQANFGLKENRGLDPYIQKFASYVRGTPKDPKGGLIAAMQTLDAFLWDNTDPVRIAERVEANKKIQEAAIFQRTLGELDGYIGRLKAALLEAPHYLPSEDLTNHKRLLEASLDKRTGRPEEMAAQINLLKPVVEYLETHITENRDEERARFVRVLGFGFLCLILLIGAAAWVFIRGKRIRGRREKIAFAISSWKDQIANARSRYVDFDTAKEDVLTLRDKKGRTGELFNTTIVDIDKLAHSLCAMELQVLKAGNEMRKGGFFNEQSYINAEAMLLEEFNIKTEDLDAKNLFGSPNIELKNTMNGFKNILEALFSKSLNNLQELKEAVKISRMPAIQTLPHSGLDALLSLCAQNGLKDHWLCEHPLFGDDASDHNFYSDMDQLREDDPLTYKIRMTQYRRQEEQLGEKVKALVEYKKALAKLKETKIQSPEGIVLASGDDPQFTLVEAYKAEGQMEVLLNQADDYKQVEVQFNKIQALYVQATAQAVAASAAEANATTSKENLRQKQEEVSDLWNKAETTRQAAAKIHRNMSDPEKYNRTALKALQDGDERSQKAGEAYTQRRYLEARKLYTRASEDLDLASKHFKNLIESCAEMDKDREKARKLANELGARRSAAATTIRKYGRQPNLSEPNIPSLEGTQDFSLILVNLNSQQQQWDSQAQSAQRAYEAEQARIRAEQEAHERAVRRAREAAEEAAESARRSSSSSNDSWSGGSSSGGSDTGSSGSSSGGCDW